MQKRFVVNCHSQAVHEKACFLGIEIQERLPTTALCRTALACSRLVFSTVEVLEP